MNTKFRDAKQFVKDLVSSFDVAKNDVKLSVINFSSFSELSIKFSNFVDRKSFDSAVDNLQLIGLKTRIDKALRLARNQMFTKQNGAREGVQNLIILMTDGSQTGSVDPSIMAKVLRNNGFELVVFGIGRFVKPNQLRDIAGESGRYYTANTFLELINYVKASPLLTNC